MIKKPVKKGGHSPRKTYWRNLMDSTTKRMSRGASNIATIISWARGENWRGKKESKKPPKK